MLFSGKIPFHVAAPICYDLPLFVTIRDCSPLFALFETIRTIHTIRYSLFGFRCSQFAILNYSLFAIHDYSLFAIRVSRHPKDYR